MSNDNLKIVSEWVKSNVIPKLATKLGKSNENVHCEISFPENCFFLSCVCFVELIFDVDKKDDNTKENKLNLVIKRPPLDKGMADHMHMTIHFHNEILFYNEVARGNPRFPRCLLTLEDSPENTVIVIENMNPHGYKVCEESYDIPIEYVFSAITEIAKFHAMAYVMKEKENEHFKKVASQLQEARFIRGDWINLLVDVVSSRSVPWLRKNNVDSIFCDKVEKLFDNAFEAVMLASIKPVEPLATLCHGDFTRNNIFFRRNETGNLEAMLIDFAVMAYSSPGIDLSTFLYLNCSNEDRSSRFNDIFGLYHKTLITDISNAGVKDLKKYSYENMLAEYKRVAAFGYCISSFFLPLVRDPTAVDVPVIRKDLKNGAWIVRKVGGEEMDEVFAKMILELRDLGCLDHLF